MTDDEKEVKIGRFTLSNELLKTLAWIILAFLLCLVGYTALISFSI